MRTKEDVPSASMYGGSNPQLLEREIVKGQFLLCGIILSFIALHDVESKGNLDSAEEESGFTERE